MNKKELQEKNKQLQDIITAAARISKTSTANIRELIEERDEARAWARKLYRENQELRAENEILEEKGKTAERLHQKYLALKERIRWSEEKIMWCFSVNQRALDTSYVTMPFKSLTNVIDFLKGESDELD